MPPSFLAEIIPQELAAVFVLVAVKAEILPVGAVRGVVPGIAVLVVHGQLVSRLMIKLPAAFGAHHPMNLEGALPVATVLCHLPKPSSRLAQALWLKITTIPG
jgi:hypothetical protein